jgi:glycosyltransferase involved in cell wall biosynthesis
MKRVLIPLPPVKWGGLHAFVANLAPAMRNAGWEFVIVVPSEALEVAERLTASGLETVSMPLGRLRRSPLESFHTLFNLTAEINALTSLCKERNIDILQAVGGHHYHGLLTARATQLPLVWQLHSNILPPTIRKIVASIIRHNADAIMTNGEAVARSFFGTVPENTYIFYAPVDATKFTPNAGARHAVRCELGIPQDAFVCGTIGNRVCQKNHQRLMAVAEASSLSYPGLRYLVVGAPFPEYAETYKAQVENVAARLNSKQPGYVTFANPESRVPYYLNAFDMFILTSRAEGVPIALFEAGAMSLPAVSVDVGSIAEVIRPGVDGAVVSVAGVGENTIVQALAAHVVELAENPGKTACQGKAFRARISHEFSIDTVAAVHIAAYEQALLRKT